MDHKMGGWYAREDNPTAVYVLCWCRRDEGGGTGVRLTLVNLETGVPWSDGITVERASRLVSAADFETIARGMAFIQVKPE